MTDINNAQDIMDSRDIIEKLEELNTEQDSLVEEYNDAKEEADDLEEGQEWEPTERLTDAINSLSEFWGCTPEEVDDSVAGFENPNDSFHGDEETHELQKFADQLEGYGDWDHGETIIRESYFTAYCQDLVSDIGDMPETIPSYIVIDWDATANNLQADYTEAEFDGVTYYMRA